MKNIFYTFILTLLFCAVASRSAAQVTVTIAQVNNPPYNTCTAIPFTVTITNLGPDIPAGSVLNFNFGSTTDFVTGFTVTGTGVSGSAIVSNTATVTINQAITSTNPLPPFNISITLGCAAIPISSTSGAQNAVFTVSYISGATIVAPTLPNVSGGNFEFSYNFPFMTYCTSCTNITSGTMCADGANETLYLENDGEAPFNGNITFTLDMCDAYTIIPNSLIVTDLTNGATATVNIIYPNSPQYTSAVFKVDFSSVDVGAHDVIKCVFGEVLGPGARKQPNKLIIFKHLEIIIG